MIFEKVEPAFERYEVRCPIRLMATKLIRLYSLTLITPYDNFSKDNNNLKIISRFRKISRYRLVTTMTDKKDPRRDSAKDDALDDDGIIDLTEEVIATNEEDDGIIDLQDNLTDDSFDAENDEDAEDQDLTVLEPTSMDEPDEKEPASNPADRFADDAADIDEDERFESELNALLLNEDEPDEQNEDFEFNDPDDDNPIILDNEQDSAAERLTETEDDNAAGGEREEDLFDFEDEIELEYEPDEDDDELPALDEEGDEDQADFFDIDLGETETSGLKDLFDEQTEYVELESGLQKDSMDMHESGNASPPNTPAADPEALGINDIDDLPDLSDAADLEFEDDEGADNIAAGIEEETDSGDEIIARTLEQSLNSDDDNKWSQPVEDTEFITEDAPDALSRDANLQEDDQFMALEDDEPLEFEDQDGLLDDLEDVSELDEDDEIIPLDDSDVPDAESEDDIVEITEFDQHYSVDDDKILEQAGILDPADIEEDEFLELIDVEEDLPDEESNVAATGDPDEKSEYPEIDDFFNEEPEEGLNPEDVETAVENASSDGSGLPEEETDAAENEPRQETAVKNEAEEEPFIFNFDAETIDKQIDGLDAFLAEDSFDEPDAASLPGHDTPEENAVQEDFKAAPAAAESAGPSAEQIDKAVERVINEKFAGRIENIIYEVIEKAVAKEIDRLKGVLLDSIPPDDDY